MSSRISYEAAFLMTAKVRSDVKDLVELEFELGIPHEAAPFADGIGKARSGPTRKVKGIPVISLETVVNGDELPRSPLSCHDLL